VFHVGELGRRDLRGRLANAHCNHALALAALGRSHKAIGDYEVAVALLGELVNGDGRDDLRTDLGWAAMNYGLALAAVGRTRDSMAEYDESLKALGPLGTRARVERARVYLNRSTLRVNPGRLQDATAAVELLTEAVAAGVEALQPDLARAYLNLASVLLEGRDWEGAGRVSQAAIDLLTPIVGGESRSASKVELAGAYYHLGLSYHELRKHSDAVAPLTNAIGQLKDLIGQRGFRDVEPTLAKALRVRAAAYQALGQNPKASADLRDAIELLRRHLQSSLVDASANLASALITLARIQLVARDAEAARLLAQEAIVILTTRPRRKGEPNHGDTATLLKLARRVLRDATTY
jgi:tetratricopeptide (TPR) repeat protein